jgi:hypothetical protein
MSQSEAICGKIAQRTVSDPTHRPPCDALPMNRRATNNRTREEHSMPNRSLLMVVLILTLLATAGLVAQTVKITEDGQVKIQEGDDEVVVDGGRVEIRSGSERVTVHGIPSITVGDAEVVCQGNQDLTLRNRKIEADGVAIIAQGNCDLDIIDSEITSGSDVAVLVQGNAEVEIRNSHVAGVRFSVVIQGNAEVEAAGTTFVGKVSRQGGNANFDDDGGNEFLKD